MMTIRVSLILLASSILAVTAAPQFDDDDNDFEQISDDYNDSQESMEQPDDVLDTLNIDHGHVDYFKHHKDMYEEPTRTQYDFTYEIRDPKTDKKKKQKSKTKSSKTNAGSSRDQSTKATERVVHYPAYSKEGTPDISVHEFRHRS